MRYNCPGPSLCPGHPGHGKCPYSQLSEVLAFCALIYRIHLNLRSSSASLALTNDMMIHEILETRQIDIDRYQFHNRTALVSQLYSA